MSGVLPEGIAAFTLLLSAVCKWPGLRVRESVAGLGGRTSSPLAGRAGLAVGTGAGVVKVPAVAEL